MARFMEEVHQLEILDIRHHCLHFFEKDYFFKHFKVCIELSEETISSLQCLGVQCNVGLRLWLTRPTGA